MANPKIKETHFDAVRSCQLAPFFFSPSDIYLSLFLLLRGDDDLLGPCFVLAFVRCRYIKHSGLDILTPIHERKLASDRVRIGYTDGATLRSMAAAQFFYVLDLFFSDIFDAP